MRSVATTDTLQSLKTGLQASKGGKRNPDVLRRLKKSLSRYLEADQITVIMQALMLGDEAHSGQQRNSGEPYIYHPIAVAGILADLQLDHECIAAAILHDTIEDTPVTFEQLEQQFGLTIANLVEGVTKLDKVKFRTRKEATAESFRKLLLAMVKDLRVILIKLADRLHNMRTLGAMQPASRRRIARETLEIYAPLADRLGLNNIRNELEDLGFSNLYPRRHKIISERVNAQHGHRRGHLKALHINIKKKLEALGVQADVNSRKKSPYSIYRKMVDKELSFSDVSDVFAIRIIVDDLQHCYVALGAVHQAYQPTHGRFKDYIALPKPNGYQSLHTVLTSGDGFTAEVQIRTREMNEVAEHGKASHWAYKYDPEMQKTGRMPGWFKNLFDPDTDEQDSEGFLESFKADLYPGQIFVFTPKGRIIDLRRGATALDFAYAIHTDVGNHAWSCKVDGRQVPLSYRLSSGETIVIDTRDEQNPKRDWLTVVSTSKARAAIRQYLRNLEQQDSIALGHRMLDKSLTAHGSSLEAVPAKRLSRYLRRHNLKRLEDLLIKLAQGFMLSDVAAIKLLPVSQRRASQRPDVPPEALEISGNEGNLVSFGTCCYPIPGDAITASVSRGEGIVLHRDVCPVGRFLLQRHAERSLEVAWAQTGTRMFRSMLRIYSVNSPGVLASITSDIGRMTTNIENFQHPSDEETSATLLFLLNVHDREHLAKVIQRLRHNSHVVKVDRLLVSASQNQEVLSSYTRNNMPLPDA